MARVRARTRAAGELEEPLLQSNGAPAPRSARAAARGPHPPAQPGAMPPRFTTGGHGRWSACWFSWMTPLMRAGSTQQLQARDLLALDSGLQPEVCGRQLWLSWSKELLIRPEHPSLMRALARTYGRPYIWLGVIKLLNDLLSFSGPLLLKLLVTWLAAPLQPALAPPPPHSILSGSPECGSTGSDTDPAMGLPAAAADTATPTGADYAGVSGSGGKALAGLHGGGADPWVVWRAVAGALGPASPHFGAVCVVLLGLIAVIRALLNSHFNYQLSRLSCQLRAGLMCVLYRKSLLAVRYDMTPAVSTAAAAAGDAPAGAGGDKPRSGSGEAAAAAASPHSAVLDVSTLMSVDSGRAVNLLLSFHELWSLPLQMGLALGMLYVQVRFAFLAGLAVALLLVPANRLIAGRILAASRDMMEAKDARVAAMSELLRGIIAVKTAPRWERFYEARISAARRSELRGLAVRKYLDALCVYFWAATGLLFCGTTFGLVVALRGAGALSPGLVAASLALFGLLTGPLNAFPWVVNGVVEAVVSVRRLQDYLTRPETKSKWAYEDLQLHLRDLPTRAAAAVLDAAAAKLAGGGGVAGVLYGSRCGVLAALREAGEAAAAEAEAAAAAAGSVAAVNVDAAGARPMDRLLRSLRLPPAAAAALTWRSRVRASRHRKSGTAAAGTATDSERGAPGAAAPAATLITVCVEAGAEVADSASPPPPAPAPAPPALPPPGRPPVPLPAAVSPPVSSSAPPAAVPLELAACLQHATFAWDPAARPCLYDITLAIPRGGLTVVVGRVGSGKSSLLAALLGGGGGGGGELPLLAGACRAHVRRLSYAPQQPWVMGGTLRDNVLLGSALDERLYWRVLHDVGLLPDLEAMGSEGDLAHVGDNGCKLSGGQRARLGLARALYHVAKPRLASTVATVAAETWAVSSKTGAAASSVATVATVTVTTAAAAQGPRLIQQVHSPGSASSGEHADLNPDPDPHLGPPRVCDGIHPDEIPDLDPDPDVMVLLDDVLASLDRSCAAHVVQHALLGRLLRPGGPPPPLPPSHSPSPSALSAPSISNQSAPADWEHLAAAAATAAAAAAAAAAAPTVVLVSSDVRCIRSARLVVVLEAGRVAYAGGPEGYFARENCLRHQHHHHQHHHHQEGEGRKVLGAGAGAAAAALPDGGDGGGGEAGSCNDGSATSSSGSNGYDGGSGSGSGIDSDAGAEAGGARPVGGAARQRRRRQQRRSSDGADGEAATVTTAAVGEEANEEREVGHVQWHVYGRYGRAVGGGMVVAVLLSLALMQASRNASDLWVSYFAAHSGVGGAAAAGGAAVFNATPYTPAWSLPLPSSLLLLLPAGPGRSWCSGAGAIIGGGGWPHPFAGVAAVEAAPIGWPAGTAAAAVAVCPNLTPTAAEPGPSPLSALIAAGGEGVGEAASSVNRGGADGNAGGGGGGFWSSRTFLWGLLAICLANSVFTLARAFSFAFAGMRAAALLHEQLLRAVMAAPLDFFSAVPHGRVLNRFSADVTAVDDSLPFIANIALANAASLAGLIAVLGFAAPPLLPLLLPLGLLYRRLQLFYRSSSREVRRLEALALSPVYGAFSGVAEAAPLVRAYGAQSYFLATAVGAITRHQRAAITGGAASAWLGLRLQLLASGLVAAVAGLAVWRVGGRRHGLHLSPYRYSASYDDDGSSGGGSGGDLVASLAGLSLAYALPVVGLLNGLLTSTAETEQEMVAVERLAQYIDTLQPQPLTLPPLSPLPPPPPPPAAGAGGAAAAATAAAPSVAALRVESLVVRYRGAPRPALSGLSLVVAAGQHVGLVGRTGAGKSSAVAAVVRLMEAEEGRILLYGVDVRSVPLPRLRASVGVLLQRPFLASATVRENLDPAAAAAAADGADDVGAGGRSDSELCAVLRLVGLWDALAAAVVHRRRDNAAAVAAPAAPGPPVSVPGAEQEAAVLSLPLGSLPRAVGLSAGQQQLLCMARLLLRPRRLVLLDECSAHVDPATAAAIRRLVSEHILRRRPPPPPPAAAAPEPDEEEAEEDGEPDAWRRRRRGSAEGWSGAGAVLEVAHDLAAVVGCDRVVVLEAGRAVEEGPPGELAGRPGGRFRELCLAAEGSAAGESHLAWSRVV